MPAFVPRPRFAAPFVVTLAGATACVVASGPPPTGPGPAGPPPSGPPPQVAEAPRDDRPPPVVVAPDADPSPTPTVVVNPPPPGGAPPTTTPRPTPPRPQPAPPGPKTADPRPPPPVVVNPPPPLPAARWTIARDGKGCVAMAATHCVAGASCNPPPPRPYACPAGVKLDSDGRTVVERNAGDPTCRIAATDVVVPCPT